MNNYYKNLYDINFFSEEQYQNKLQNVYIQIINPGYVQWETWRNGQLGIEEAKSFYKENTLDFNKGNNLHLQFEKYPEEVAVLVLLICEDAYRTDNERLFTECYSMLSKSSFQNIRLKAMKLHKAFYALKLLSENLKYDTGFPLTRIEKLHNHALSFINKSFGNKFSKANLKVETPVLKDWEKRKMDFLDIRRVEDFYKTTPSYVLELIAANHQVETLFNYSLVIDKLKELGVQHLYDYAGGIGTFVLLAKLRGVEVTFSELDSITRGYAIQRIEDLRDDISSDIIEYDSPDLNSNQNCIVCTEVLEHIYEPENLVEYFYTKLINEGILVVSESFDYTDNFCTHIPKHKGKGGKTFIKYMKKVGFEFIPLKYQTHPLVFRKKC